MPAFDIPMLRELLLAQAKVPGTVIVFDLGRVLVYYDDLVSSRAIAERTPHEAEVVLQLLHKGRLCEAFLKGQVTADEFWSEASRMLGLPHEDRVWFWNAFVTSWHPPAPEMLDVVESLRKLGVPLALLSNLSVASHRHLLARHPEVFALFDREYLSYACGVRKPERAAFRQVERDFPDAARFLFVDDHTSNLATAIDCGWGTIHFELRSSTSS